MFTFVRIAGTALALGGLFIHDPTRLAAQVTNYKVIGEVECEVIKVGGNSASGTLTVRIPEVKLKGGGVYAHLHGHLVPHTPVNPKAPPQMRAGEKDFKPTGVTVHNSGSVQVAHRDFELSYTPDVQVRWHKFPKAADGSPGKPADGPAGVGYPALMSDLKPGQVVVLQLVVPHDAKEVTQAEIKRVVIHNEIAPLAVPPEKKK